MLWLFTSVCSWDSALCLTKLLHVCLFCFFFSRALCLEQTCICSKWQLMLFQTEFQRCDCLTPICRTILSQNEMHTWHVVSELHSHNKALTKTQCIYRSGNRSSIRSSVTAYAQLIISASSALLTNAWSACY